MPDASDSGCPELPPYRLRMEKAQNGEPAPVLEVGGERFYMASRYDPSRESERWVAGLDVKDGDLVVLVGGGARAAQSILNTGRAILLAYFEPFSELALQPPPADGRARCFTHAPDLMAFLREVGVDGDATGADALFGVGRRGCLRGGVRAESGPVRSGNCAPA